MYFYSRFIVFTLFVLVVPLLFSTLGAGGAYAQASSAANGLPQELVVDDLGVGKPIKPEADSLNSVADGDEQKNGILGIIESGHVGDVSLRDKNSLKEFYETKNFKPVWVNDSLFSQLSSSKKRPEEILNILKNSWKHGLNPKKYNVAVISSLLSEEAAAKPFTGNSIDKESLDVLISDAIIGYGQDITGMRVDAREVGLSSRYWRKPMTGIDVLNQIYNSYDAAQELKNLAPKGALYKAIQLELERLYRAPISAEETKVIVDGVLRPGQSRKSVLSLRKRMGFDADASVSENFIYDDGLAQSVMAFQKAHGLKPDGIIGSQTLSVMNKTRDDRINQALVNLERLRWLNQEKPEKYIVVNVPAAKLWAIEDGEIAFDMKVIVGRYKRQTNIFNTEITGVRFNPTWTVPPTIKEEDFLPKLQNDPMYLADRGIEVMQGGGTLDPTTVDWTEVSYNDLNGIQMVQQPGSNNPLGKIRVFMSNPYNIYLHDTNHHNYFDRANRALSSGCIRMEDAPKIAYFIMKNNKGWSEDKMERILASGKKTDVSADVHVPVYLLYQTIWFGDNGQLVYGHDIYDRDIILRRALNDIDGVGYPENMSISEPSIPKIPKRIYAAKRVKNSSALNKKKDSLKDVNSVKQSSRGSFRALSSSKIKSKKKESIDLLTFNE